MYGYDERGVGKKMKMKMEEEERVVMVMTCVELYVGGWLTHHRYGLHSLHSSIDLSGRCCFLCWCGVLILYCGSNAHHNCRSYARTEESLAPLIEHSA